MKNRKYDKIDTVRRAIEFKNPTYLPIELLDVPQIYTAYHTLDPETVEFIPGTEDFDAFWLGYNWTLTELGETEEAEPLRKDEWGVLYKVPKDKSSAYVILENPLRGKEDLSEFDLPDISIAAPFFANVNEVIDRRYRDRFITGYIDPGPFLVAFAMLGYDNLLMKLIDDLPLIKELIRKIFDFQKKIVLLFKGIGAHMINLIDEIAGTGGLMFSPAVFVDEFLPMYKDFFAFVHEQNMYSGILFDGNISAIFEGIMSLETDCVQFMEPNDVGVKEIADYFKGKKCIRASVDMRDTLARATPEKVEEEAHRLVRSFNTREGGYMPVVIRWYRPTYPEANVLASVRAFNAYR